MRKESMNHVQPRESSLVNMSEHSLGVTRSGGQILHFLSTSPSWGNEAVTLYLTILFMHSGVPQWKGVLQDGMGRHLRLAIDRQRWQPDGCRALHSRPHHDC